ncbi:hypothetical protein CYY_000652 [Polysphondylium violaceum]|uniref:RING-type domain-containing protein n=1 Tax=Polysphondylium violaceum TaxID=133409 RepID=A0A8J4VBB0_9MYCE|nr:hypothetical protein CYY_000652 [Polysphondylium violaceum]
MNTISNPFPLLIAVQSNHYRGLIDVLGKEYYVDISLPSTSLSHNNNNNKISLDTIRFDCDREFKQLLSPFEKTLENRLVQCKNINQFLFELQDIIERLITNQKQQQTATLTNSNTESFLLPFNVFNTVISELEIIGWNRILKIDRNVSKFSILLLDEKKREFIAEFSINEKYPDIEPNVKCLLPKSTHTSNSQKESKSTTSNTTSTGNNGIVVAGGSKKMITIISTIEKLEAKIKEYQEFFDIVEEIDAKTWVLEPENPKRSDVTRRIALKDSCSLLIEINPKSPKTFPVNCQFLGPEQAIDPLRKLLNQRFKEWSFSKGLLENLEYLMNIKFPLKENTRLEEFSVECGVCYSHRLYSPETNTHSIPNVVCKNHRCQKQFHQSCLYEWLKALPNPHYSFNIVYGKCPYCTDPISVSTILPNK